MSILSAQFHPRRLPQNLKSQPQLTSSREFCATSGRMTQTRTSLPRKEPVAARPTCTSRLSKRLLKAASKPLLTSISDSAATAASTPALRMFQPPTSGQLSGNCSSALVWELP